MPATAKSDYEALRGFRTFELLNTLRWSVSLDSFKVLIVLGSAALFLLGTLVLSAGLTALRDSLFAADAAKTLWLGVLVIAYCSTVLLLSELVSNRRLAVTGMPHLELFRSMELPIKHVVLRYGVVPLLRRLAVLWYSAGVFFVVFFEAVQLSPAPLLTTISVLALTSTASLFCVLRLASLPARRDLLRASSCVGALLTGLILGAATSVFMGTRSDLPSQALAAGWPWINVALFVAGLAFGFLCNRSWKRLSYARTICSQQVLASSLRRLSLLTMLLREFLCSKQGSVLSAATLSWILVTGSLLGAFKLLPISVESTVDLHRALVGVTLLLSLGITEPVLYRIGPTVKQNALRFAWENGLSTRMVVTHLLAVYYLLAGIVGVFAFGATYLLFGTSIPQVVLVSVIVMAAGIISEFAANPGVSTDGTKSADIMDALYTLVLVSPCSAVLGLEPAHSALLLLTYTIVLSIGVVLCLRTTVIKFRCTSTT